jgi:hypothetical protein
MGTRIRIFPRSLRQGGRANRVAFGMDIDSDHDGDVELPHDIVVSSALRPCCALPTRDGVEQLEEGGVQSALEFEADMAWPLVGRAKLNNAGALPPGTENCYASVNAEYSRGEFLKRQIELLKRRWTLPSGDAAYGDGLTCGPARVAQATRTGARAAAGRCARHHA